MKKRYYLIEPLDIDGDKNSDGFLISQYRIDKYGNKIFLKNKYVTYEYMKSLNKNKTGGRAATAKKPKLNVKIMNDQEYINFLNYKKQYQQQYPQQYSQQYSRQYPHQYPHQYPQQHPQQHPPEIVVRNAHNFTDSMKQGFGLGLGFQAADAVGDIVGNGIGYLFGE